MKREKKNTNAQATWILDEGAAAMLKK